MPRYRLVIEMDVDDAEAQLEATYLGDPDIETNREAYLSAILRDYGDNATPITLITLS